MTTQQKKFMLDLIHAALDLACRKGIELPIDLARFGKLLRDLEPDFTHQAYGYEKLLHLLRGEFYDLLDISKDQTVDPPRYYVSIHQGAPLSAHRVRTLHPETVRMPPAIDPSLVDGGLLERYLASLAESSARAQQRFEAMQRRLAGIEDRLAQSRVNEVSMQSQLRKLDIELAWLRKPTSNR